MDKTKDNTKRNVSPETLVLHVFFYIWKQKVDFVEKIKEQGRKIGRNREGEERRRTEEGNRGVEERGAENWSDTLSKSYSTLQ